MTANRRQAIKHGSIPLPSCKNGVSERIRLLTPVAQVVLRSPAFHPITTVKSFFPRKRTRLMLTRRDAAIERGVELR